MIKSRLQCDSLDPRARQYKGVVHCATQIHREGGAAAFTQGLVPCLLRAVPTNALLFFVLERVRRWLDAAF